MYIAKRAPKEWLQKELIEKSRTQIDVISELGICRQTLSEWLKYYGLSQPRSEWVKKSQITKGKRSNPLKGVPRSEHTKKLISKANKGMNHGMWKGGRIREGNKMIVWVPGHPHARTKGYIYEHRLIMEKHIGRYLKPLEVVHHVDRNPLNNNLDNLILFGNQTEHMHWHKLHRLAPEGCQNAL